LSMDSVTTPISVKLATVSCTCKGIISFQTHNLTPLARESSRCAR
jgi:hypothetical protein